MPPARRSLPRSAAHAALGDALRDLRTARGFTQEDLADAADVHLTHIGGIERGQRNPSYSTLLALAAGLGVQPGELISLADRLRGGQAGP